MRKAIKVVIAYSAEKQLCNMTKQNSVCVHLCFGAADQLLYCQETTTSNCSIEPTPCNRVNFDLKADLALNQVQCIVGVCSLVN